MDGEIDPSTLMKASNGQARKGATVSKQGSLCIVEWICIWSIARIRRANWLPAPPKSNLAVLCYHAKPQDISPRSLPDVCLVTCHPVM